MKLVVVGGSAHSTPNLFAYAPLREAADEFEIVLAGRSEKRLAAVARAIRSIGDAHPLRVACERIDAESGMPALRGADIVLCQARYGGYEARTRLVKALKVPDVLIACLEDAIAIGGGLFIVSRF